MRIAVLGTRGVPSGYSGYEVFVEEIGWRFVEKGHEVTIYAHSHLFKDRLKRYRGMRIRYVPSLKGKNTSQFSHSLLSTILVCVSDADVVLFCNASNGPFGLFLKAFQKKCAINVNGLEWKRPKWGALAKAYFRFGARCASLFFDAVVTDAMGMQAAYWKEFGVRSVDIAYGANIWHSKNPERVKKLGLEPQGYYLIASRLVPDNNADLIVKAFVQSISKRTLAIAGGAQYKNPFEAAIRKMADHRVMFLGHIDDSDLIAELHCNAYAYIHGHEFGGTNPALLKGLAYGNCILALNTVFNREVLEDGEHGILFEKNVSALKGAIEAVDCNAELAESYRAKSRDRIRERYTWEIITAQYEDLFTTLHRLPS